MQGSSGRVSAQDLILDYFGQQITDIQLGFENFPVPEAVEGDLIDDNPLSAGELGARGRSARQDRLKEEASSESTHSNALYVRTPIATLYDICHIAIA